MAIKIKLAGSRPRTVSKGAARGAPRKPEPGHHFTLGDPIVKMLVAGFLIAGILFMAAFAFLYVKYEGIVDRRMAGPLFNNSAKIYARPRTIGVGAGL